MALDAHQLLPPLTAMDDRTRREALFKTLELAASITEEGWVGAVVEIAKDGHGFSSVAFVYPGRT